MCRKFIAIPMHIWQLDIGVTERVILSEIVSLHQQPNGCYASNRHFAELCRITISAARKAVTRLADKGYIRKDYADYGERGGSDQQRLLCPLVPAHGEPFAAPPAHGVPPIKKENKKETKTGVVRKRAKPSGLDEVLEAFGELGELTEAEGFYNYYEANGWVQGRSKAPIKDWKAAARRWILNSKQYAKQNKKRGYQKPDYDREALERWADK